MTRAHTRIRHLYLLQVDWRRGGPKRIATYQDANHDLQLGDPPLFPAGVAVAWTSGRGPRPAGRGPGLSRDKPAPAAGQ